MTPTRPACNTFSEIQGSLRTALAPCASAIFFTGVDNLVAKALSSFVLGPFVCDGSVHNRVHRGIYPLEYFPKRVSFRTPSYSHHRRPRKRREAERAGAALGASVRAGERRRACARAWVGQRAQWWQVRAGVGLRAWAVVHQRACVLDTNNRKRVWVRSAAGAQGDSVAVLEGDWGAGVKTEASGVGGPGIWRSAQVSAARCSPSGPAAGRSPLR